MAGICRRGPSSGCQPLDAGCPGTLPPGLSLARPYRLGPEF